MVIFKILQKPFVFLFLFCLPCLGAIAQSKVDGMVNDVACGMMPGVTSAKVQGNGSVAFFACKSENTDSIISHINLNAIKL